MENSKFKGLEIHFNKHINEFRSHHRHHYVMSTYFELPRISHETLSKKIYREIK